MSEKLLPPPLLAAAAFAAASATAAALAFYLLRPSPPPPVTVSSLHVYPVKGLRGISLPSAEVDSFGLLHDRRWLLAAAPPSGPATFLTQRTVPRMATLSAHVLTPSVHAAVAAWAAAAAASGRLALSAAEALEVARGASAAPSRCGGVCPSLSIHGPPSALLLCVDRDVNKDGKGSGDWVLVPVTRATDPHAALRTVRVWDSAVPQAVDQGEAAAAWLSAVLPSAVGVAEEVGGGAGATVRLLYQDPQWAGGTRQIKSSYMPLPSWLNPHSVFLPPHSKGGSAASSIDRALRVALRSVLAGAWWAASRGGVSSATGFADGFPLLLASEESLADLNVKMAERAGGGGSPLNGAVSAKHCCKGRGGVGGGGVDAYARGPIGAAAAGG